MLDIVVEQLSTLAYALLASVLGAAGFVAESAGFDALAHGQTVLGVWETLVGLLLLIAAVKLVRERILADGTAGS